MPSELTQEVVAIGAQIATVYPPGPFWCRSKISGSCNALGIVLEFKLTINIKRNLARSNTAEILMDVAVTD